MWCALVLIFIFFKFCGGQFADCVSCDCSGGQPDAPGYMFARGLPGRARPSLPPIVIVNGGSRSRSRSRSSSRSSSRSRSEYGSGDIEYRGGADGELDDESERSNSQTLLLRSSSDSVTVDRRENSAGSVVVV